MYFIDVRLLVCYTSTIIFCNAQIWNIGVQSTLRN